MLTRVPYSLSLPTSFKEQNSDTVTPWHSDEAYWLDLPDKRSLSFWFPMQDVNVTFFISFNLLSLMIHKFTKLFFKAVTKPFILRDISNPTIPHGSLYK